MYGGSATAQEKMMGCVGPMWRWWQWVMASVCVHVVCELRVGEPHGVLELFTHCI